MHNTSGILEGTHWKIPQSEIPHSSTESTALSRDDRNVVLHPFTNLRNHTPLVMTRGEGVWVYDEHGNRYLEGVAGLWSASLGFSEQRLVDVAHQQLKKLPFMHMFASVSHPTGIALAKELLRIAPVPMAKVFFANSGSEAVDSAVKMIWFYNNAIGRPEKKKFIARHDAYHGSLIASSSLTGLPNNHKLFDLPLSGFHHTTKPHYLRFAIEGESELEFSTRLANDLDTQIQTEGPETVAAFIAEPVMGVGGVIVPPEGYFDAIQSVLKKHDVLLIADEVICGLGRTGNMWGSQTVGMKPDVLITAKALSASYLPISAVMINQKIYQALESGSDQVGLFAHGMTYSGHPVSAAVALECLRIYEEDQIVNHVRNVGEQLQTKLRERVAPHPLVGEVRGRGMIAGVELFAKKGHGYLPFPAEFKVGIRLRAEAIRRGLILRAMGNTLGLSPPLIINEEEVEFLVTTLCQSLDALKDELAVV
ncbi:MAG: aminotransferase [Bacteroidetes bacterium]|nr:aminotransferase [Bacteroidota bacterium]